MTAPLRALTSWTRTVVALAVVTLCGVLLLEGTAWAEPEPNDTMATAVPLAVGPAGITDGQILPASNVDFYAFTVASAGMYVAEAFNVAASLGRMQLQVLNAAGTSQGSDTFCYYGTGNVCGRVQVEVSVAGTYFVEVLPSSPTAYGTYSVRVLPRYDQGLTWDTASEPDDVRALAPAIAVGRAGAVNRVIYPRDPAFTTVAADTDVVRFDAPGAGTYVAEVFNVASGLGRMRLGVYNSAGTLVGSDTFCYYGTGNVCGRVQVEVSVAGTYFVEVLPSSPTAYGTYSVRVLPRYDQGLTWDREAEDNDTIALAYPITAGIAQGHTIAPRDGALTTVAGDNDVFRLQAQASRTYVVTTRDVSASLSRTNLLVYDSAGTLVTSNSACSGASGTICNQVQFTTSLAGNYFLRVQPSTSTSSGTYSICARLSTTATCSVNPLKNPGFELDRNADGRPDSWTSDPRFTRSTAIAPHGGAAAGRLLATDDSSVTVAQTVANQPLVVPYTLSGWINIPATTDTFSVALRIRWRDAAGATLAVRTVKTYSTATAGWNRAAATLTAPAGTNNAVVELAATSLNATAVYVDDIAFTPTR